MSRPPRSEVLAILAVVLVAGCASAPPTPTPTPRSCVTAVNSRLIQGDFVGTCEYYLPRERGDVRGSLKAGTEQVAAAKTLAAALDKRFGRGTARAFGVEWWVVRAEIQAITVTGDVATAATLETLHDGTTKAEKSTLKLQRGSWYLNAVGGDEELEPAARRLFQDVADADERYAEGARSLGTAVESGEVRTKVDAKDRCDMLAGELKGAMDAAVKRMLDATGKVILHKLLG